MLCLCVSDILGIVAGFCNISLSYDCWSTLFGYAMLGFTFYVLDICLTLLLSALLL